MNIFSSETDLSSILESAESLIRDCVHGRITFEEFLEKYDSFYMTYELDGHESDVDEKVMLRKFATKVALHKAIWDEIITRITADEYMTRPEVIEAGFIGHAEGLLLLKKLSQAYLGSEKNPSDASSHDCPTK